MREFLTSWRRLALGPNRAEPSKVRATEEADDRHFDFARFVPLRANIGALLPLLALRKPSRTDLNISKSCITVFCSKIPPEINGLIRLSRKINEFSAHGN